MNILYYAWNEYCSEDIQDCFDYLGYKYKIISYELKNKLRDEQFEKYLGMELEGAGYDCIFTFNYFPAISNVANRYSVPYISWMFDSSLVAVYTDSVFHSCNRIFCFDRYDVEQLSALGVTNVYHMPLAANVRRINRTVRVEERSYINDVAFMGNLYRNQFNFYDQIHSFPDYYQGYFDSLIRGQMNLFGFDLPSDVITEEFYEKVRPYLSFNLDRDIIISERKLFIDMMLKKVTVEERKELLELLAKYFDVMHYGPDTLQDCVGLHYGGYLDYENEMPWVFLNSKINLNISLRIIHTGIPLRCIDIMAAGGFLLSNWQPELAELFRDGEELAMYQSREDLVYKVQYYLEHPAEREEIAQMGKKKIEEQYNYEHQVQKIMELAGIV